MFVFLFHLRDWNKLRYFEEYQATYILAHHLRQVS